jgi:hypothetical protein
MSIIYLKRGFGILDAMVAGVQVARISTSYGKPALSGAYHVSVNGVKGFSQHWNVAEAKKAVRAQLAELNG